MHEPRLCKKEKRMVVEGEIFRLVPMREFIIVPLGVDPRKKYQDCMPKGKCTFSLGPLVTCHALTMRSHAIN